MALSPSTRQLPLRAVVGALALCLTVGGISFAGSASAAEACPTYTDPAGDSTVAAEPTGVTQDDDLDILAVSHSVDAGVFSSVLKIAGLTDFGSAFTFYDRFNANFTVAGKVVQLRGDRAFPPEGGDGVATGSLRVAGVLSAEKVTAKFDLTASTVTLSIAVADLEKAVGAPLAGKPFTAMTATSSAPVTPPVELPADQGVVQLQLPHDTATAAATSSYVFGGSCSGGGGTPGPTPTPEPSEEPEEEPGEEEPEEEEPVDPFLPQPRAGCFLFKDAAGDAYPGIAPLSSPESDPDLDLTEVSVKSGISALEVFAKVTDLGASPTIPIFTGHSFSTSFSIGGKAFSVQALGTGPATSTPASMSATAKLDETANNVVFTIPLDDIETVLGGPLTAGTAITNLTVVSNASNPLGDFDGDTATGATPAEKTHAFGNNACFMPPAGKLTLVAPASGAFSDKVTVVATLLDAEDEAVEDARVVLKAPGQADLTATTSDEGKATFVLPLTASARSIVLSAIFAGNPTVGAAGAGQPFTIKSETTVLKAVAGKGTVTATLTDNDKTAVAGKTVVFTVGKKVTKVVTNAKGVAVLKKQVKGSTVKVGFAGVKNFYVAAKSVSAKVL